MQYKQARQEEHQAIQEFTETELYKMTAKDPNILEQNQQERTKELWHPKMETIIEEQHQQEHKQHQDRQQQENYDGKVIQEKDHLHQYVMCYKQFRKEEIWVSLIFMSLHGKKDLHASLHKQCLRITAGL